MTEVIEGNFIFLCKCEDLESETSKWAENSIAHLAHEAPRFKDPSFMDEKEWRFVWNLDRHVVILPVRFRPGKSMIVPYVPIPLTNGHWPVGFISEIIVGPTTYPDLSVKSVEALLKRNNIKDCFVRKSAVPYRKL